MLVDDSVTHVLPTESGADQASGPDQPGPRRGSLWSVLRNDRRVRYVFAGSLAAAVYYTFFFTGWLALSGRLPYLAVAAAANLGTAVTTYPVYRGIVFQWTGRWWAGLVRFYIICLWGLLWSVVGLPLLVELAHIRVLVAQAIVIVATPLINYQLHRFWVFRQRR
jgi:putative flippase GtrA